MLVFFLLNRNTLFLDVKDSDFFYSKPGCIRARVMLLRNITFIARFFFVNFKAFNAPPLIFFAGNFCSIFPVL